MKKPYIFQKLGYSIYPRYSDNYKIPRRRLENHSADLMFLKHKRSGECALLSVEKVLKHYEGKDPIYLRLRVAKKHCEDKAALAKLMPYYQKWCGYDTQAELIEAEAVE